MFVLFIFETSHVLSKTVSHAVHFTKKVYRVHLIPVPFVNMSNSAVLTSIRSMLEVDPANSQDDGLGQRIFAVLDLLQENEFNTDEFALVW